MPRIASIAAPAGTTVVRHGVSFDGKLLALCVAEKTAAELFKRDGSFAKTMAAEYEAILLVNNRRQNTYHRLRGMTATFPMVQLLPDGTALIVAPRCLKTDEFGAEQNAKVLDASGNCISAFTLGDGIEDVQVSETGEIWVSYFDEGVLGNFGWTDPMGSAGLVRFDATGKVVWQFNDGEILDCYALNVFADRAMAYYYTSFQVAEVKAGGGIARFDTPVEGARALVYDSQNIALVGGYGEDQAGQATLLRRSGEKLEALGVVELALENAEFSDRSYLIGRGRMLYVATPTDWYAIEMHTLSNAPSSTKSR